MTRFLHRANNNAETELKAMCPFPQRNCKLLRGMPKRVSEITREWIINGR